MDWLGDHFWCNTCVCIRPKLPWWDGMWVESVWILGKEFQAAKCQGCGSVMVWPKEKPCETKK